MQSVQELFSGGRQRLYDKGQIILYQGELNNNAFYITAGYIKVYDITSSGAEKLLLLLGPGDIFPIVWSDKRNEGVHYFYEAYSDLEISTIRKKMLMNEIETSHSFAKDMLKYFMTKYQDLSSRIECIDSSSAKHKVAQVLEYAALAHGQKIADNTYKLRFPLTHQSIANMAGITRETASLQLKDLADEKMYQSNTHLVVHTDRLDDFLSNNR